MTSKFIKSDIESIKAQDPFILFSKIAYLGIIQDLLKDDPTLWIKFSHEKQTEIHAIKKELDIYFKELKQK